MLKRAFPLLLTLSLILFCGCSQLTETNNYTASVTYSFDKSLDWIERNVALQTLCVRDFLLLPGEEKEFCMTDRPVQLIGEEDQTLYTQAASGVGACAVGTAIYECFRQMDPDSIVAYSPHEASHSDLLTSCAYDPERCSRILAEDGSDIPPISLHDGQTLTLRNTQDVPIRLWVENTLCPQGLRITATITLDETFPTDVYNEYTEDWYGTHYTLDDIGLADDSIIVFNRRTIDPSTGRQAYCTEHLICFEYGTGERDYWKMEEETEIYTPSIADLDEDGVDEVALFVDLMGAIGDVHVIKNENGSIVEVLTAGSCVAASDSPDSSSSRIDILVSNPPDVIVDSYNTALLLQLGISDTLYYWIVDWNGTEYEIIHHARTFDTP